MKKLNAKSLLRWAGAPLLSCLLTFALFLVLNACFGIFPCGEKTIVWCDMEQQAVPLLVQFKTLMQQGESIMFSPLDAGGMRFYAVFFFFLSNPLSLLTLVSDTPADLLVVLLVIIKLALASGTAALWLRYRVRNLTVPLQILLGMMYGCSGYGLFYYQNLMWLDIMLMLPLLMLSLRMLLKKAKPLPYLLTLTAMMTLCFYLGYMLVIFILLYVGLSIRVTVPAERRGKVAVQFILSSLLAACLSAWVWLPCFLQVRRSARGGNTVHELMNAFLLHHLGDKICLLGATCLGFASLVLLWQKASPNTVSRRRDRGIFVLLTLALVLDPINMMWHAGSYQAFPLRWGMIPILLMLTLAGRQLTREADPLPEHTKKLPAYLLLGGCMLAAAGTFCLLHFAAGDQLYSYVKTLWVDTHAALWMLGWFLVMTVTYLTALMLRQSGIISRRFCTVVLAVLFLGEFAFQYDIYFGHAANADTLFAQTTDAADRLTAEEDTARLRMTKKYAHANMLGALGYPTLAHYTSLTRADFMYGMKRLGYSSYWMEVSSTGGTLLSDALWNVQYQLGTKAEFPSWTDTVWTNGRLSIAKSNLTAPSAFCTDMIPEEIAELPEGSRIAVQQAIAKQMLGLEDVVSVYQPTLLDNLTLSRDAEGRTVCRLQDPELPGEIRYSLFIPKHEALYFDLYSQTGTEIGNSLNGAVSVMMNGRTVIGSYPENNANGFVFLGEPKQQYIVVRIKVNKDFTCESFGVFGIGLEAVSAALENVSGTALSYENGVYTASCRSTGAEIMVLSAAYDEGFTATLNGQPAELLRVNSCQMGVQLHAGINEVKVQFHTEGLKPALLLGGFGILAAAVFLLLRRRIPEAAVSIAQAFAEKAVQAGYWVLIAAVYVMPLVLWLIGAVFALLP